MVLFDLKELQVKNSKAFNTFHNKINTSIDSHKHERYYFSIAKKQGDWFGTTYINFVLKQPQNAFKEQSYLLYFEKSIELDEYYDYSPTSNPIHYICLLHVKMIARQHSILTIAFLNDKRKLDQWNIHFSSAKIAEEWQMLLGDKKKQAKQIKTKNENKDEVIRKLNTKLKTHEEQLYELRNDYDKLLFEFNTVKQDRDRFRQIAREIEVQLLSLRDKIDESGAEKVVMCDVITKLRDQLISIREQKVKLANKFVLMEIQKFQIQKSKLEIQLNCKRQIMDFKIMCSRNQLAKEQLMSNSKHSQYLIAELHSKIQFKNKQIEELTYQASQQQSVCKTALTDLNSQLPKQFN